VKWPSDPVLVVQCAKIVESQWEILVRFASEPVFLHSTQGDWLVVRRGASVAAFWGMSSFVILSNADCTNLQFGDNRYLAAERLYSSF
jgi:hypothetical protein